MPKRTTAHKGKRPPKESSARASRVVAGVPARTKLWTASARRIALTASIATTLARARMLEQRHPGQVSHFRLIS